MFTRIGKVIAVLAVILGVLRIALGFLVAFGTDTMAANEELSAMYLASANSGEAISEGTFLVLFGVFAGVAVEISTSLQSNLEASRG